MAVDRQGGTPVFGAETAHKLLNPAMPCLQPAPNLELNSFVYWFDASVARLRSRLSRTPSVLGRKITNHQEPSGQSAAGRIPSCRLSVRSRPVAVSRAQ